MSNDSNSATSQPNSRTITHNQRDRSSDVNPMLQSSSKIIVSDDDNYIVGRQKKGQLHNILPGFNLSFKDSFFNSFDKYYEVDKRTYPFVVTFKNMASAQATFKFDVTLKFTLKVLDPCAVVKENRTSLLECIYEGLEREVQSTTKKFLVQKTDEARMSLETNITSFTCPEFLTMTSPIVDIMPDEEAKKMMRELEQKNLEVALISKKTEIDSATVLGGKVTEAFANNVEEHQIQKHLPNLIGKVLNSDTTPS